MNVLFNVLFNEFIKQNFTDCFLVERPFSRSCVSSNEEKKTTAVTHLSMYRRSLSWLCTVLRQPCPSFQHRRSTALPFAVTRLWSQRFCSRMKYLRRKGRTHHTKVVNGGVLTTYCAVCSRSVRICLRVHFPASDIFSFQTCLIRVFRLQLTLALLAYAHQYPQLNVSERA